MIAIPQNLDNPLRVYLQSLNDELSVVRNNLNTLRQEFDTYKILERRAQKQTNETIQNLIENE